MTEARKTTSKLRLDLRSLRLSLKYRPEILRLILKMRLCIRKKNILIIKLKHRLKEMESKLIKDDAVEENNALTFHPVQVIETKDTNKIIKATHSSKSKGAIKKLKTLTRSVQTEDDPNFTDVKTEEKVANNSGWKLGLEDETKSIAEQVKEAAQEAMKESGMVYVESAGMYYDYKTGYYYNSELGLYYHTDTGCYYYYSEDKQGFVFHSYPDRNHAQSALLDHVRKKNRKHKMEPKTGEEEVENLRKNLAQDGEERANEENKPKRKKSKKKLEKKISAPKEKKQDLDKTEKVDSQEKASEKSDSKMETDVDTEMSEQPEKETVTYEKAEKETPTSEQTEKGNVMSEKENEETTKSEKEDKGTEKSGVAEAEIGSSDKAKENIEKARATEDLEDGECSDTSSEGSESDEDEVKSNASTATASDDDEKVRSQPPCMRVIISETKVPSLRVGTLFIVTKEGGTLGREGKDTTVLLKDDNVSRSHLYFQYDLMLNCYMVTELGSKNGTILNGLQMSENETVMVPHGSTIMLGETKLLCHIHPGNDTCGHCEPGLIMEAQEKQRIAYTRTCSVKRQHELELARLKNKYGAKPMLAIESTAYNDRAQVRRETVGSSHPAEKTQASDIGASITPDNKGFKLLEKMGWNKGEGLGKDGQGNVEPVPLIANAGKMGLGAPPPPTPTAYVRTSSIGPATMRLASRTKMLQPPAKAFQGVFDSDSE